jgi:hypothetical protein
MNLEWTFGGSGRGAPIEDPALIRQILLELHRLEVEFPIKVQGAHTLPYTSQIQRLDTTKGLLHLKLIRPLPHEMVEGAVFDMLIAQGEQRFEAQTVFRGREDYLLYRFDIPAWMVPSDRRSHKRYPFRPREKAFVIAQDGGIPGHGISGPLVNLSLGGLAFRVDRVMRLSDQLRVTPGLGFFDRGKSMPMIKVRDLPNLPAFQARGILSHALERDGEILVGIQFGELASAERAELKMVLDIREHMLRAPAVIASTSPREVATLSLGTPPKAPAAQVSPNGTQTPDALKRMGRRSTRLMLTMAPGPDRDRVHRALLGSGYLRLETADSLDLALSELRSSPSGTHSLLVFEPPAGQNLPLADLRSLQRDLGEREELPVALITQEGSLPETGDALIRPMPWPTGEDLGWLPLLDDLAGLSG